MFPSRLWVGLLDLLAPPRCPGCDDPGQLPVLFCEGCAPLLEPAVEEGLEHGVWRFEGPLADAVHRFKYRGRADLARPLADALWLGLSLPPAVDLVTAVPLHPRRLRARGYNQSALLAARVARHLGARLALGALVRARDTPPQVGVSRSGRQANVRDAFAARGALSGRRILVVDDVRTSGATLGEACRALRCAGAAEVRGLALAQAPLGGTTPA